MATRTLATLICQGSPFDINDNGFTIFISDKGEVYSCGSHLECGHGHSDEDVCPPRMISGLQNIKSINCTHLLTLCLDTEGNVLITGENNIAKKLEGVPPINQVSCGKVFTMCLSENNELFSFGENYVGQLGLGNTIKSTTPKLISSLKDISFVDCGAGFTFCITLQNEVYCWGRNDVGQLGLGNTNNQHSPVKCESCPNDIVDIKCGDQHVLLLTSTQEVYSCGCNEFGQLARETDGIISSTFQKIASLSDIVRIECGANHSMCIDSHGNFYVFGHNFFGQLGLGDTINRNTATKHPSLSNVIDISSKGDHTFVKTSNGVFAFGNNKHSQLGTETDEMGQYTPIQVLQGNENIWCTPGSNTKAKSARK